jgi:hypothetical protein
MITPQLSHVNASFSVQRITIFLEQFLHLMAEISVHREIAAIVPNRVLPMAQRRDEFRTHGLCQFGTKRFIYAPVQFLEFVQIGIVAP